MSVRGSIVVIIVAYPKQVSVCALAVLLLRRLALGRRGSVGVGVGLEVTDQLLEVLVKNEVRADGVLRRALGAAVSQSIFS